MCRGGTVNILEYIGGRMLEEFCGCSDGGHDGKKVQGGGGSMEGDDWL